MHVYCPFYAGEVNGVRAVDGPGEVGHVGVWGTMSLVVGNVGEVMTAPCKVYIDLNKT